MTYMEVSGNHRGTGTCSDDSCPCGYPGASIPRGTGYMYVSKDVVDFRRDCPTEVQAKAKIDEMSRTLNSVIMGGSGVFAPILMCEQGARKRGLDLATAAADAKHWWATGKVPLRATPAAGTASSAPPDVSYSSYEGELPSSRRQWWQFWKS